jgi:predicted PilT family ATPase
MKDAQLQTHAIRPLVLISPGMIDAKTVREMRRAGYLVVETKELTAFRVVTPPPMVPLDGLAAIALEVMADEKIQNYDLRDTFRRRVLKAAMGVMENVGGGEAHVVAGKALSGPPCADAIGVPGESTPGPSSAATGVPHAH